MGLGLARGGAGWRGRLGADLNGIQAQNLLSEDAFGRLGLGWGWGWLEGGLGAGAEAGALPGAGALGLG